MEIINRLSVVAHDEKLFKWVLEGFKAELFDDDNKIDLTLKFRDEIGKYYSKIRKDALIKDDYEIYKVDTFCMVYLAEMFNKIDEEQELKLKAVKRFLQMKSLTKEMKIQFETSKAKDYLNVLEFIFSEDKLYQYGKTDKKLYFKNTERMLDTFSLKLLNDLFCIKPKFFVGLKKSESCSITHLGLITVPFEEDFNEGTFFELYSNTINHILSIFMNGLYFDKISNEIEGDFLKKYSLSSGEEFETMLLEEVSAYILQGTIGNFLKDVTDYILELNSEENKIHKKYIEIQQNRKDFN